jgi:hypothetical protein
MPPRERPIIETNLKIPEIKVSSTEQKEVPEKSTEEIKQEQDQKNLSNAKAEISRLTKIQELRLSLGATETGPNENTRIETELAQAKQEAEKLEGSESEIKTGGGRRILLQEDIDRSKRESSQAAALPILNLYDQIREVKQKIQNIVPGDSKNLMALKGVEFDLNKQVSELPPEKKAIYFWNEKAHEAQNDIKMYQEYLALSPEAFAERYGEMAGDVKKALPEHIERNTKLAEEAKRVRDDLITKLR